jgi:hypothetical protein
VRRNPLRAGHDLIERFDGPCRDSRNRHGPKNSVTHIDDGFDFLGMNVRKYGGKLLIKSARENVHAFLREVRDIAKGSKALRHDALIRLPVRDGADAVQRQALGSFERIAKEGRKYGFSLLVVSQRPADVSRTILSQCNNFLALRLTNETDQGVIKRLMPDSLAGLSSILPLLDTGEALLLGDAVLLPTRIKLDVPKITPDSATRDFWREWGTQEPQEDAIKSAIESLRSQARI